MKNIIFFALMTIGLASCSNNTDSSKTNSDSSKADTSAHTQTNPDLNSGADTSSVQGKGSDRIPSRTGTTGQGNTTVTGTATGSPTGTGKDTLK